jgi:hypothetical protein
MHLLFIWHDAEKSCMKCIDIASELSYVSVAMC